ncbi:hypothetical protein BDW59DRAFT_117563 [Aspergillus cavernicola]|uniref:Uncharacterized protein n=1 Tax=Aspergillus cavernicola TaxID=176166 RepID=A0ABR4HXI6_9EURO
MHSIIITLIALITMMASANTTTANATLPNLPFPEDIDSPMEWDVKPSPDTPEIVLTGTVEEVYAQLLKINPNYDEDWKDDTTFDDGNELEARGDISPNDTLYCSDEHHADSDSIKKGIAHLRKVKGKPKLYPRSCKRISCSWLSGIFWCNFNHETKTLPSYNNIAQGAQVIYNHCRSNQVIGLAGTLDHTDHWRVDVAYSNC